VITYNWNVEQMDTYPEKDGLTDVVFKVHWTLVGTEENYRGSVYGTVLVTLDEESIYTPYNELTQEQVVGWIKESLGAEKVTSYEDNVATQIQS